jgi:hypothetical protein
MLNGTPEFFQQGYMWVGSIPYGNTTIYCARPEEEDVRILLSLVKRFVDEPLGDYETPNAGLENFLCSYILDFEGFRTTPELAIEFITQGQPIEPML